MNFSPTQFSEVIHENRLEWRKIEERQTCRREVGNPQPYSSHETDELFLGADFS